MGPLNHSQAQIIQQLLVDLGKATLPVSNGQWPCYYNSLPDTPDDALCVYNTEGRMQGRIQITGDMAGPFGIQVKIRSDSVVDGYVKGRRILNTFDRTVLRNSVTLEGSSYLVHSITRTSDVLKVTNPLTDSRRHSYTINALASIYMLVDGETGTGT